MILLSLILITAFFYYFHVVLLYKVTDPISNVYIFVWTVIMVFSVDAAVAQLLQKSFNDNRHNRYLGVNTLYYLDDWYIIIHKFVRSFFFNSLILYFVAVPIFIFGKPFSYQSLFLYFWQTDYIIILLVLILLIISDFQMPYYLHLISNHKDSLSIKSYIMYTCRYYINSHLIKNDLMIKYTRKRLNKIWRGKTRKNIAKHEECDLICLLCKVIFNYNTYSGDINIQDIYNMIQNYINNLTNVIRSIDDASLRNEFKIYKYVIQNYSNFVNKWLYTLYNSKHLYVSLNKIDLLPFNLVNEKCIHDTLTWGDINHVFYNGKFINVVLGGKGSTLNEFRYKKYGYENLELDLIQNNIIQLIDNEVPYLLYEFKNRDRDNNLKSNVNSLKNPCPVFFDKYIKSFSFKSKVVSLPNNFVNILKRS